MKVNFTFLPVALLSLLFSLPVRAVEPWADAKLPVKENLELWLDASRENEARKDFNPPAGKKKRNRAGTNLGNDSSVDYWHDASGNGRNVHQPVASLRPKFAYTASGFV